MIEEWYEWWEMTALAAALRGEKVYERMLVPDEVFPGEYREETDDELRERIKRDLDEHDK